MPVELLSHASEGLADLTFDIDAIARRESGGTAIIFYAQHEGHRVGMGLEIATPEPGGRWHETRVALIRFGPESDALLSAIASAFGLPALEAKMVDRLELTAASLGVRPTNMLDEPAKLTLRYEGDAPFEWLLLVDRAKRIVELSEKDPEYRGAIVSALTER